MMIITLSFVFLFGLIAGSFFNVLIWRLPRGESIVSPPSHCTSCNAMIPALHNIPVVSYLFLRGRCGHCGARISPIYPLVEFATALVAVLFWAALADGHPGPWWNMVSPVVKIFALLIMVPVTIIDLRHYIIPDIITYTGIIAGLAVSFIPGDTTPLLSLLGILAGGGSLALIGLIGEWLFRKGEAMGGGDIKLMAFAGAMWGPKIALLGIMSGAFLGAAAGIVLIVMRKLDDDHRIPFGPFLGAGVWIAVLFGDKGVMLYMRWIESLLLR